MHTDYIFIYTYTHTHTHTHVCVCVSVCLCVCVSVCLCLCVCVHARVCILPYRSNHVCRLIGEETREVDRRLVVLFHCCLAPHNGGSDHPTSVPPEPLAVSPYCPITLIYLHNSLLYDVITLHLRRLWETSTGFPPLWKWTTFRCLAWWGFGLASSSA